MSTTNVSAAEKVVIRRNREKPIQKWRLTAQLAFAGLCSWIGIEFYQFVKFLESGTVSEFVTRPPGADGFLPISSLMNLYYFLMSGDIHGAHPAGLFILLGIILLSIVIGKAFCSWFCPVGFVSEMLGDIGEKIFKRRMFLPRWLDWPLRSLKYLILLFFVYSIFFKMSEAALKMFLDTPYNMMSDVKMYYFFAEITQFALTVVAALFFLSIVIRNFWCRFLCPYGALLGITALLSLTKIKRNEASCIDCNKCAKACPSNIKVDKVLTVISDECHSCLNCVDACPIENTLEVRTVGLNKKLSKPMVAATVVAIFLLVTGLGMLTDNWQNRINAQHYLILQETVRSSGHPTGMRDIEQLNKEAEKP